MSQMSSSGWLLAFIISLLLSLLMGLALVWLSIERTDKAYSIRQLRNEVEQRAVLKTKLEVERDRLLAPHVLRRKAIQLGMSEAKPGQIRRMPIRGLKPGYNSLRPSGPGVRFLWHIWARASARLDKLLRRPSTDVVRKADLAHGLRPLTGTASGSVRWRCFFSLCGVRCGSGPGMSSFGKAPFLPNARGGSIWPPKPWPCPAA